MPARVVVSGMLLIILATFLVATVEFFLPLSAKCDMNSACRAALLRMEADGGLPKEAELDLALKLSGMGFCDIIIDGTASAKRGEEMKLHVEADYSYSRISGLFTRTVTKQRMVYDKTSVSRRVIN